MIHTGTCRIMAIKMLSKSQLETVHRAELKTKRLLAAWEILSVAGVEDSISSFWRYPKDLNKQSVAADLYNRAVQIWLTEKKAFYNNGELENFENAHSLDWLVWYDKTFLNRHLTGNDNQTRVKDEVFADMANS